MNYSLLNYLETEDFKDQKLLTNISSDILASINIKYISVIEPPVGNFVRKQELVLTTAIGCLNHEDTLLEFIREIYIQGACALVIAIENPTFQMPQSVLDFGNKHSFPIINAPWHYRFGEIIEKVHSMTSNAQHEHIFWENLQNQLLKLYLSNHSLDDALNLICQTMHAQKVTLTDNYFEKAEQLDSESESINYILKIGITHRTYSYLVITNYDKEEYHIDAFEQYITTPLNFWFDREQSLSFAKSEMVDEFVWKLANQEFNLEDGIYIKARHLGIRMDCSNICVVGRLCITEVDQHRSPEKAAEWLEKNANTVFNLLIQFKEKAAYQIIYSLQKDILVLYFERTPYTTLKKLNDFLDQIEKALTPLNPSLHYYWGISSPSDEKNNFHSSYHSAAMLADICYRENKVTNRYTKKEASGYLLLEKSINDKKTQQFANDILKPLYEYKSNKGTDLIHSLDVYLSTGGNISESARLLFVHRQTFIYHIKKIETLLHMDLSNHDDYFLLELCMKIATR